MNVQSITPEIIALNKQSEQVIRDLYAKAEKQDVAGFVGQFSADGSFTDVSAGVTYRGHKEIGKTVEIYAEAFPDMHRELIDMYVCGDIVIVELTLNGTHKGPLRLPHGTLLPTGKKMTTPCCDVFRLVNGKVVSFHCYTAATILLGQLGVFVNLEVAFAAAKKAGL
jgi:ketosteroid isomerase-like protein